MEKDLVDFHLCATCERQLRGECDQQASIPSNSTKCVACFGAFNADFIAAVADEAVTSFKREDYDAKSFVLAFNLPTSMTIRETIFIKGYADQLKNGTLKDVPFKLRLIEAYISKIQSATGLRPTLHSNLTLTITIQNDEFSAEDVKFCQLHFPDQFSMGGKKKRRWNNEKPSEEPAIFTKNKLTAVVSKIDESIARQYQLRSPTQTCSFSLQWESEDIYIAGRYCKYSRFLPQSPWTADDDVEVVNGHSVSEIISNPLAKATKAQSTRFIASGREDIDVRMLGTGRPFVVQLINPHHTIALKGKNLVDTLLQLEKQINAPGSDVNVIKLTRITKNQIAPLSVGQEEKKKCYTALCYSPTALSTDQLESISRMIPLTIRQLTPIRVLKRRPLLNRPRTIFQLNAIVLDGHRFLLRLETQAEFIHGDFGRTRPNLRELLSNNLEILDLDVEHVDLEWPPPISAKN